MLTVSSEVDNNFSSKEEQKEAAECGVVQDSEVRQVLSPAPTGSLSTQPAGFSGRKEI